jgi:ABC-type uncharacterized transport system permease subunit
VFLGRVSPQELLQGFLLQLFWLTFFLILGQAIWKAGLRKYTAVGG